MSEIATSRVEFPGNGAAAGGYLARPQDGGGPGVDAHIQDVTERFARAGYVALAPDLYHGQVAAEPDEARKLVMELDRERVRKEVAGAARYLQSLAGVAPPKIGVIGWCMGGAIAFAVAHLTDQFAAAVGFYGRPPSAEETANINCPVLGLFGGADQGIPPAAAEAFRAAHAFFNDARPSDYQPDAAQDAWHKTLDWFQTHLS